MSATSAGRRRRVAIRGIALGAILLLWQLAGSAGGVAVGLVSSPVDVVRAGLGLVTSGELVRHGWASLVALGAGFGLAAVTGTALGIALGSSRRLRLLLDPLVMAFGATPRIALLPLLVVWLGVATASKVAAVFLGAVFPIVVGVAAAVQQVDADWIRAARAFGADRRQLVTKILLPAAAPAAVTGLRLGFGRAVTAVIVAEMYVALAGLGLLLRLYGHAGRTAELIALVALVAFCGAAGSAGLRRLEVRLSPWRRGVEL